MRGSDFKHWYNWVKKNEDPYMTYEEAHQIYFDHYDCTCESCKYRIENGFIPIPSGIPGCKCPTTMPIIPSRVA